jgi:23S rRNA (uracil1939-C5)-methyltransferase
VERGTENAQRNNLANLRFLQADLTLPPDCHAWLKQGFDKVLLDPPRSGALEVLPAVVAARLARIVYVSCNPATLARDLSHFAGCGWATTRVRPFDMFPHTPHVECVARLDPAVAQPRS